MTTTHYIVCASGSSRCRKCGGKLQQGQGATAIAGEGFAIHEHQNCPQKPARDPERTVIQGSTR